MYNMDLNIFAIIILVSLLAVIYLTKDTINQKSRLFRLMIIAAIMMNLLEIFSWIFDTLPGNINYILNFVFNGLLTAFNTIVVGLWACYMDYIVYKDIDSLKKKWYYFLPTLIMIVLSIINIFYPILFEISADNVYSRLPLIWTSLVLTVFMYVYVLRMVIKNNKIDNKKIVIGVLIFLTTPILAAIFQLRFYGYQLIWPSTALAILLSYLIFETTSNSRDYLTGLFNRDRVEDYINRSLYKKKNFSVIMLDLNDFKHINDTLGHHFGDQVLVFMANTLKEVFAKNAMVSRYGGDEFIIISDMYNENSITLKRKEIELKILQSEDSNFSKIKFSFGVAICLDSEKYTFDTIIIEADNKMYEDKDRLKQKLEK